MSRGLGDVYKRQINSLATQLSREIEFDDKEQELEELRKKVLEANKQKVSEQEETV